ncbi:TPA: hypothetical protein ACKP7N_002910 [Serratia marcescens]
MTSLSELSKPVAWTDAEELRDLSKHRCAYMFIIDPENPYHDPRRQQMLYSQEYVSALMAELEVKDKRIAELEAEITNIVDSHAETVAELRAKLATPVRLPGKTSDLDSWDGGWDACLEECAEAIRAAGYRVEGNE